MLTLSEFNQRYQVGINSLDGSPQYTHNKKVRRQLYKQYVKELSVNTSHTHTYFFASLPTATTFRKAKCQPCSPCGVPAAFNQEQGNNPMNYASASISTPATETQDQRKYLTKRLEDVYCNLRDPLEATFGLIDDETPSSPKDLAERLAAGKFIIRGYGDDAKNADRYRYWPTAELIQWRDPAKKADTEGFEVARKALKAEKQKALDIIKIDEPKAGLEAIKVLEAWTPTGAAN